jgi:putative membrane protein
MLLNIMKKPKTPFLKRPIVRILIIWIIQTAALVIMSILMESVYVESLGVALIVAAVIGLLNALLWPLLTYILVPFAVLTLGIASLLLNGLMVWIASLIVSGFTLTNFWSAFWLALGMSVINVILSSLLTIDDESSWYRNSVRRRMKRQVKPEPTDVPGIFFLEIDGLARPILEKAIENGYMPNLARWLESGSHVLTGWETDTSSQTSAGQAGILHGNNDNIPAFRWYDKKTGEVISSSSPKVVAVLEQEHSDGNGLLVDNGTSRGNLLSGDAPYVFTTASTLFDRSRFHPEELQAFFSEPYSVSNTLIHFIWDVIQEMWQFYQARKNNVQPILDRAHRGGKYPLVRASQTVLMRHLNIYTLVGDMFSGRSSSYSTFVAYDEIAHHSGILDPAAFDILNKLDKDFGRLERASKEAPRPYHLVVLSDHGQSKGATFLQRYGKTLEEFVQELMSEDYRVESPATTGEGVDNVNVLLNQMLQSDPNGTGRVVGALFRGQMDDGQIQLGDEESTRETEGKSEGEKPDVYALASGNLGLVFFTRWPERITLEEISQAFPDVVPGLVQHEGIGFIMVHSEKDGPVVLGKEGVYYLRDERVDGSNPLAGFGPNAAQHLRRTDSFPNCPDILVNSFYDAEKDEGCAFEELIGFHGGMGGTQTHPFVLHPVQLEAPDEALVGAASVYELGKRWLEQVQKAAAESIVLSMQKPGT